MEQQQQAEVDYFRFKGNSQGTRKAGSSKGGARAERGPSSTTARKPEIISPAAEGSLRELMTIGKMAASGGVQRMGRQSRYCARHCDPDGVADVFPRVRITLIFQNYSNVGFLFINGQVIEAIPLNLYPGETSNRAGQGHPKKISFHCLENMAQLWRGKSYGKLGAITVTMPHLQW